MLGYNICILNLQGFFFFFFKCKIPSLPSKIPRSPVGDRRAELLPSDYSTRASKKEWEEGCFVKDNFKAVDAFKKKMKKKNQKIREDWKK